MSRRGHRFYLSEPLAVGHRPSLTAEQSRQITNVLRLRPDDHITLFNSDGTDYDAVLLQVGQGRIVAEICAVEPGVRLPGPPVELALAIIKSDRFEWALQKVTELGVHRVIPMNAGRGVISLRVDREGRRRERWRRIAVEAAEQCGRSDIPQVDEVTEFADVVAQQDVQVVVLWEDEDALALPRIELEPEMPIRLVVGPEGGFSPAEIEAARWAGARTASLGPLILRSETAAVAAVSMLNMLTMRTDSNSI